MIKYNLYVKCYNNITKDVLYEGLRQTFDNESNANDVFNKMVAIYRKCCDINSHEIRKFSHNNYEKHFYAIDCNRTIYTKIILKKIIEHE